MQRVVFWALHFPKHQGVSKIVELFKSLNLYIPDMNNVFLDHLTQCSCCLAKENLPPPVKTDSNIMSTHPLSLVAIDLYEFGTQIFLTLMDISQDFLLF